MILRAHFAYLWYVSTHKWFVFVACVRLGVPLRQALMHDCSKFTRAEWHPYVNHFYHPDGSRRDVRDSSGSYDPAMQSTAFRQAWLHHQKNQHHWQAWVTIGDKGALIPESMPLNYAREMVADWMGAGRAQGKNDITSWYEHNKDNMLLTRETRRFVESVMDSIQARPPGGF